MRVWTGADVRVSGKDVPPCEAEDGAGPVYVSSASLLAAAIEKVMPSYPPIARQARVQGSIAVEVFVDSRSGAVACVRVLSGVPLLDGAVVEAVRSWKFDFLQRAADTPLVAGVLMFGFSLTSAEPPVWMWGVLTPWLCAPFCA